MPYELIDVAPVPGPLGAEVKNVDLSQILCEEVVAEIRQALLEHLVLFFRDQNLTPNQHKIFARRFGELDIHPYSIPLEGHPEILEIVKEKEDTANFGGQWHTDMSYSETPPLGVVLVGRQIPVIGGDTIFASMYSAYDALSNNMKEILSGLVAIHSAGQTYGQGGQKSREDQSTKVVITNVAMATMEHPVVRTHPETGRKCLFVNPGHTDAIKGFTEEESNLLLNFLFQHSVRAEFTCRFTWRENSMAFWDNRCTQHVGLNDYHGHRRVIHRIVVRGEREL